MLTTFHVDSSFSKHNAVNRIFMIFWSPAFTFRIFINVRKIFQPINNDSVSQDLLNFLLKERISYFFPIVIMNFFTLHFSTFFISSNIFPFCFSFF